MMRVAVFLAAIVLFGGGCAWFRKDSKSPEKADVTGTTGSSTNMVVTPEMMSMGRVVRVNESARFVVMNFPAGGLPSNGQRLYVYRQGLKVGEVRVTPPQSDDNAVADIVNGEAQVGDEIRAR